MVAAARKGKKLQKEGKLALIKATKDAAASRQARDDKKWAKVLGKMDADKKKAYKGTGNQGMKKTRVRGATRRSARQDTGRKEDTVAYDTTIHLSKLIQGKTFHKRAPCAVKRIKNFVAKFLKVKDVKVDGPLNSFIWSQGVKGVPTRVRVRVQRKVAESRDGAGKRKRLYTVVSHVPTTNYKGLLTKKVQQ
jgi:large subunit ribosomal protein L31e